MSHVYFHLYFIKETEAKERKQITTFAYPQLEARTELNGHCKTSWPKGKVPASRFLGAQAPRPQALILPVGMDCTSPGRQYWEALSLPMGMDSAAPLSVGQEHSRSPREAASWDRAALETDSKRHRSQPSWESDGREGLVT